MTKLPVSYADMAECARREVRQREKVYPRLVKAGTMTAKKADYELQVMKEIAAHFEAQAEKEKLL